MKSNPVTKVLEKEGLAGEGVAYGLKVVSKKEAWLGSMGGASRLVFDVGGAVQVDFFATEVCRIVEAIEKMERLQKRPDQVLLAALETVQRKLTGGRRTDTRLRISVPLAVHAVDLNPIVPEISG